MLVLEILQTCTSVLFAFDLRLFLVVLGYFLINLVFYCLKKSDTFWLASVLRETKAGQSTGSCSYAI